MSVAPNALPRLLSALPDVHAAFVVSVRVESPGEYDLYAALPVGFAPYDYVSSRYPGRRLVLPSGDALTSYGSAASITWRETFDAPDMHARYLVFGDGPGFYVPAPWITVDPRPALACALSSVATAGDRWRAATWGLRRSLGGARVSCRALHYANAAGTGAASLAG